MFKNAMNTESIPERVFALYQLVKLEKRISTANARNLMEQNPSDGYFNKFKETAIELEILIEEDGQFLILNNQIEIFENIDDFRRYVVLNLSKYNQGNFYKATKRFLSFNLDYLNEVTNIGHRNFMDMVKISDVKEIRGWRFWASFLGIVTLNGSDRMLCIPNPTRYLSILIDNSNLEISKKYSVAEFVSELGPSAQLLLNSNENSFNYGLSSALRILYDLGRIELIEEKDTKEQWKIYSFPAHKYRNLYVTHLMVKEG